MNQKVEFQAFDEMFDAFVNSVKLKAVKKELSRTKQRGKERKRKLVAMQGIKIATSNKDDSADAGLC